MLIHVNAAFYSSVIYVLFLYCIY